MLSAEPSRTGVPPLIRLLRLHQWVKGAFVLIGPVYAGAIFSGSGDIAVVAALVAFGLASSGCYIFNDMRDAEADRAHPRKRFRPIAAGQVGTGTAVGLMAALLVLSLALPWVPMALNGVGLTRSPVATLAGALALSATLVLYIANTTLYSLVFKHRPIIDVMSLSLGFVLRVLGGCAAVMVEPSTWLLNVTLFLAMFLAFGKRLGERRSLGDGATQARGVQSRYSDDLLRMVVVVTAVACLITYAGYVQAQSERYTWGFNLLWLTMLPATYGLLRALHLVERGEYDDPTQLAINDRPFQLASLLFAVLTVGLMVALRVPRAVADGGG
jgi:decaprenyl-phosphate phosphoribosyltransferase